jgi:hypothetical protein
MSLAWIRRSSRAIAVVLLLTSMLQFPHPSLDDELCSTPGTESHDASKHVFTADRPTAEPGHCAICHWTRWMNPVFTPGPVIVLDLGSRTDLSAARAATLRDPSTDQLPPRAPPAV